MQQSSIGVFLYCLFAPLLLCQGFAVCIAPYKEILTTIVDVEYCNKEMSVQHKSLESLTSIVDASLSPEVLACWVLGLVVEDRNELTTKNSHVGELLGVFVAASHPATVQDALTRRKLYE